MQKKNKHTQKKNFKNGTKFFNTNSPSKTKARRPKQNLFYFFLFATVLALPLRVLAFVFVLCPRTGS